MAVRKIPMRKCAGCEQMKEKRELIRVVHTPNNEVLIDFSGKKSGRGVYICKNKDCFLQAQKKKGLERSLKCSVSSEVYEGLLKQLSEGAGENE